jgi:hypothetical protein
MMSVQVFESRMRRNLVVSGHNSGDLHDAPLSVWSATHMNDNVNRRIHHVARILQSPTWCGLHSEQIESVQTIYSRIGMQGC